MKLINLLPGTVRAHQDVQRFRAVMVLSGLIAICLVVVPWIFLRQVEAQTKLSVDLAQQRTQNQLAAKQAVAGEQQREQAALVERVTILNSLAEQELNWGTIFTQVGELVPKEVSLTTFAVSNLGETTVIKIGGVAPSNVSFATFQQSLQQNAEITSVVVDGFTFNAASGTVTFAVSLTYPATVFQFESL